MLALNLFRLVDPEEELHREINSFSISHSDDSLRLWNHSIVLEGERVRFFRHPIRHSNLTELNGKEKWTAYETFTTCGF
jgi:hypothetical protein